MDAGSIVAVGKTSRPFAAYRVSSRSFPNRVAAITDAGIAIQPLDPEDMKKNPYIAYNCVRVSSKGMVVSNGSTRTRSSSASNAAFRPTRHCRRCSPKWAMRTTTTIPHALLEW